MATEAGHDSSRVYRAHDGSIHLNGAAFYNDSEVDISPQLETVLGGVAAGFKMVGGRVTNSSLGLTDIATGLTGIVGAWASPISTTAPSTAAGVPHHATVGFSTASGTLQVLALKYTSTANTQLIAATSTALEMAWGAFGV